MVGRVGGRADLFWFVPTSLTGIPCILRYFKTVVLAEKICVAISSQDKPSTTYF
jgi:hypothetical protein